MGSARPGAEPDRLGLTDRAGSPAAPTGWWRDRACIAGGSCRTAPCRPGWRRAASDTGRHRAGPGWPPGADPAWCPARWRCGGSRSLEIGQVRGDECLQPRDRGVERFHEADERQQIEHGERPIDVGQVGVGPAHGQGLEIAAERVARAVQPMPDVAGKIRLPRELAAGGVALVLAGRVDRDGAALRVDGHQGTGRVEPDPHHLDRAGGGQRLGERLADGVPDVGARLFGVPGDVAPHPDRPGRAGKASPIQGEQSGARATGADVDANDCLLHWNAPCAARCFA